MMCCHISSFHSTVLLLLVTLFGWHTSRQGSVWSDHMHHRPTLQHHLLCSMRARYCWCIFMPCISVLVHRALHASVAPLMPPKFE